MSLEKAQQFVTRMQEDLKFRMDITSKPDSETLKRCLQDAGYGFSRRELVRAMAACMEEMEKNMD